MITRTNLSKKTLYLGETVRGLQTQGGENRCLRGGLEGNRISPSYGKVKLQIGKRSCDIAL